MSHKSPVLVLATVPDAELARIAAFHDLHYAPDAERRAAAIASAGSRFETVLTTGALGLAATEMDAMPALELVCALGVGHENIDTAAATRRGIVVANGAGTNAACVADHAFGLVIAAVRGLCALDRHCHAGGWRDTLAAMPAGLTGKRLGIAGFGAIGQQIARRGQAFDMAIGYAARRARPESPHVYFAELTALADWSDVLVLALPGGVATHHAVDAGVLAALGPSGVLVNVARGSVVDTQALADALRNGVLGAAAIDVWEGEPHRPDALVGLPNLLMTPHVAGWSPEAMTASVDRFLANAAGHFAGTGVVSAV